MTALEAMCYQEKGLHQEWLLMAARKAQLEKELQILKYRMEQNVKTRRELNEAPLI